MSPHRPSGDRKIVAILAVVFFCLFILCVVLCISLIVILLARDESITKLIESFKPYWENVGSALILSVLGILLALVFFWVAPASIKSSLSFGVKTCSKTRLCPLPLQNLQEIVEKLFVSQTTRKNRYLQRIVSSRLKILAEENWKELENGKYNIITNNRRSVTEADLAYDLVSQEILQTNKHPLIKALTTYYYIPWWLTPSGLRYLNSQKSCQVFRVFLFPFRLEEFFSVSAKEQIYKNTNEDFYYTPYLDSLQKTLVTLALHWCLNIKVYLLSPFMVSPNAEEYSPIISSLKRDIAMFGKTGMLRDKFFCAIWAYIRESQPTETLSPAAGSLVFPNSEGRILIPLHSGTEHLEDARTIFEIFLNKAVSLEKVFAQVKPFCSLVEKIFGDISGEAITSSDYEEIKRKIATIKWVGRKNLVEYEHNVYDWLKFVRSNESLIKKGG